MKKVEIAYKEIKGKIKIQKEESFNLLRGIIASDPEKREDTQLIKKFKDICRKPDSDVVCQLLDKGYSIGEVQQGILTSSFFASTISEKKRVENYCDEVINEINRVRLLRSGRVYEMAKDSYLKKSSAIQNKYMNSGYKDFQEGKVVISLLMENGYFPEVVEAVLEKHSKNPKANKEYIKKIMEECTLVKKRYLDIEAAYSNLRTSADCYRLFAKEFMKATQSIKLNGRDEQKVIARMFAEGLDEKAIAEALAEASPVAIEPGRDRALYIKNALELSHETYKKKKEYAQKNFKETEELYKKKIEAKDKYLKEKGYQGIDYNRTYYDCIIAKELLEGHQLPGHIDRTIAKHSPQAVKSSEWNKNKTAEGYAKWVRARAEKALAAEKAVLAYEKKPIPYQNYQSLLAGGFTAEDLYKKVISERIAAYPSIATRLSFSYVDKDACEKILHQYPDIKIDHLKDAIEKISPRAQLAGLPSNYPQLVIEDTQARKEIVKKSQESQKAVQNEYIKQCGLASEGVDPEANILMYHDGRAVLEMLQKGINQAEIKSAIVSGIQIMRVNVENPEKYADTVIQKSEIVRQRLENVRQYEENEKAGRSKDFYLKRLRQFYEKKNYVSSSMDIAIATAMLLHNFSNSEIINVVKEFSPTAAEPGRDDKYVHSFVLGHAKERMEGEKMKLKQYTVVPRLEHEESAQKEYLYHLEKYKSEIRIPPQESVDVLIAKAMITQGFKEKDIQTALSQSPCSKERKNYGIGIVKAAAKGLQNNLGQGVQLGRTLKEEMPS